MTPSNVTEGIPGLNLIGMVLEKVRIVGPFLLVDFDKLHLVCTPQLHPGEDGHMAIAAMDVKASGDPVDIRKDQLASVAELSGAVADILGAKVVAQKLDSSFLLELHKDDEATWHWFLAIDLTGLHIVRNGAPVNLEFRPSLVI